ncbi:MAG TPA: acetylxylan esterase, partial [Polyangiaceae bacterium]|nr:acetylxylan esterase [Polyangiaceae bacterium]
MPIVDLPLAELLTYPGRNPRPDDFDSFWQAALAELDRLDPRIELRPAKLQASFAECFHLFFTGVGGARVHAKYLRPRQRAARGPALLEFHGYTGHSADFASRLGYVAAGFSVLSLDCRGQGGQSEDVGGVKGTTHSGHIVRGLADTPEKLYYRNVFLDTAQLARIAMQLDGVDPARVGARGASQGGALTLACAALEPRIALAAPVYPFLCDYQRVWEMDLAKDAYLELRTFFRHHDPTHDQVDEWFRRLGYIDIQHLAPRVRGEVS